MSDGMPHFSTAMGICGPWPTSLTQLSSPMPAQSEVRARAYELATREMEGGPVEAVIDRAERIFDWLWTGKRPDGIA